MVNAFYLVIVLLVALYALARGFRKGITGQIPSLLGIAFGAVAAQVLTPEFSPSFQWAGVLSQADEFNEFTTNLVCASVIYTVVYAAFQLLRPLFSRAMSVIETGILNRLTGSLLSLLVNLLWLSIILNLLLCFSDRSRLLSYERANDGNLVAAVMRLTPAALGCYGGEDFAHFMQLKHAKTISENKYSQSPPNIIFLS